ncbi:hypothetical protein B0H16DRAFT_1901070 [Mycena metata]|uniref:Uncharacterized protein n=1 Tax=Mycena metata TaxID=1033252 RepID=A0AAD7H040_9AGAR|nr:hypothetical protein B0H16DRAFT_1901070 [Mycena metata]
MARTATCVDHNVTFDDDLLHLNSLPAPTRHSRHPASPMPAPSTTPITISLLIITQAQTRPFSPTAPPPFNASQAKLAGSHTHPLAHLQYLHTSQPFPPLGATVSANESRIHLETRFSVIESRPA